jgi:hypothetical protein
MVKIDPAKGCGMTTKSKLVLSVGLSDNNEKKEAKPNNNE